MQGLIKKGGGGLEKLRNETNRENEIYMSGIALHTHVGTIKPTSGGAPRVGGGLTLSHRKSPTVFHRL